MAPAAMADTKPLLVAGALLLCGCSSHAGAPSSGDYQFQDISSASPAIQTAAEAVVLVTMPGWRGTGSFISADGQLLTNNHILGTGACPIEGCFAQLTWDYQRGSTLQKPKTVFVIPKAVDVGLDMALMQVLTDQGGDPLSTPSHLTVDAHDATSLVGAHVTVVGHPQGGLKKWSAGEVIDSDGNWITTSAFLLPGSSGSPMLDDSGHLVGLMHRVSTGDELETNAGVNESSLGTASAALLPAMSAPLPAAMVSLAAPVTDADVVKNQAVYLDARASSANVGGAQKPVLTSLGDACDAALAVTDYAAVEDLEAGLAPCLAAEQWIECRSDAGAAFSVCPSGDDAARWQRRYQAVYDYWRSFNGQLQLDEVSFAQAALASSMAEGQATGAQLLDQALADARPELDFHVAVHLAAFGVSSYLGVPVTQFVREYKRVPGYASDGESLVDTVLWLENTGGLEYDDVKSLLSSMHDDDAIDLGTKLLIEQSEYERYML
jgi:hypothetical protein